MDGISRQVSIVKKTTKPCPIIPYLLKMSPVTIRKEPCWNISSCFCIFVEMKKVRPLFVLTRSIDQFQRSYAAKKVYTVFLIGKAPTNQTMNAIVIDKDVMSFCNNVYQNLDVFFLDEFLQRVVKHD